MRIVEGHTRRVWCVDLSAPHHVAKETEEDRAELGFDGPARRFRRRILRAKLAQLWSVHPDTLCFERAASGEVQVTAPSRAHVSSAQRGNMMALAVSHTPIGVDIELQNSIMASDIEGLCPNWLQLTPTSRWTAFEALGKLFSVGAAVPPEHIVTRSVAPDELQLSLAGRQVRIALFPCNDHQIAIAEFEI